MKENYTGMMIAAVLAMMALYGAGMYLVMIAVDRMCEKEEETHE